MAPDNQWTVFLSEDDEDDFLFFCQAMLRTHGDCLVCRFESVEQLIELSGKNSPGKQVIIFIGMRSEPDAMDLLRQVRSHFSVQSFPVFILSGLRNPQTVCNAYIDLANSYLFKPSTDQEWAQMLGPVILFAKNSSRNDTLTSATAF